LLPARRRVGLHRRVLRRELRDDLSDGGELGALHQDALHESGGGVRRAGSHRHECDPVPALDDARRVAARAQGDLDLLHDEPLHELRLRDGALPRRPGTPGPLAGGVADEKPGRMSSAPDYDAIVVGAGHNGLAATALLAGRGLRVLCLEKNAWVGGMAGTREILRGCRNDVGASLLFPLAKGIAEELELARYGVELIDLPIMASNLNSPSSPPAIFYANPLRMARYVLRHFGVRAMVGFVRLMAFCRYPASLMDRFTPRS